MNRRNFAKLLLAAPAWGPALGWLTSRPAEAIQPIRRAGYPRFKLSLVGYSFRKYFTEQDPAKRITLFDFIDYCADQGFPAAELTGYYFPQPITDESLIAVKRHAYLRGVAVSGTSTRSNFAQLDRAKQAEEIASVKGWIRNAAVLGAPYLRVFAGPGADVREKLRERACIGALEECADYAGTKGVFLGLENDGGVTPDSIFRIVKGVQSRWFGLNLDLGNYQTADVYGALAQGAPYAINVHFKREVFVPGKPAQPADIARMLRILREANYQGYLALEYEQAEDPYQVIPGWKQEVAAALERG